MKSYADLVKINPIFQSSINLAFDLGNESKIDQYIPTTDVCNVLALYFDSILDEKKATSRASVLVGPYGKGKSFLMAVLLYLISADHDSVICKRLVEKIGVVSPELKEKIDSFEKLGLRLLPIIINSDYSNLNQAFSIALNDSLARENLSNLMPVSAYDVAGNVLKRWIEDKAATSTIVSICEGRVGYTVSEVQRGLSHYDSNAYEAFCQLYECVTYGLKFNPLVSDDITRTFSDVVSAIEEKGWNGVFIVFDEFSKFVGSDTPSLNAGLKVLQDVFELATRSGRSNQIHISCVTHKTLSEYGRGLGEGRRNAFRTVEGRVKEIFFTSSIGENYQIISWALKKAPEFDSWFNGFMLSEQVYSVIEESPQLFADINHEILFKGCFPLNPFAALSLISLSEKIAQNERTLFTFIADNDVNSLNTFIRTSDVGLLGADALYDYFTNQMEKDEDWEIRRIYRVCKNALRRQLDEDTSKFIKALAVCLIVGDSENFPATSRIVGLAAGLPENQIDNAVAVLTKENIIRENIFSGTIDFAPVNSAEIQNRTSNLRNRQIRKVSDSCAFNQIAGNRYYIPRRYNTKMRMTRYYKGVFITEKELERLGSLSNAFRLEGISRADGIVLLVIRKLSGLDNFANIMKRLERDERVIVLCPDKVLDERIGNLALDILALREIEKDKNLAENLKTEIEITLESNQQDLVGYLDDCFNPENCTIFFSGGVLENSSFNELLSSQLEKVFTSTPIINNTLVNKDRVSAQYTKARNTVVSYILNDMSFDELSPTSPEMTIHNAVFSGPGEDSQTVELVAKDMQHFILKGEGEAVSFRNIANRYSRPPFGIRRGVLPLLFAVSISRLPKSHLVIYQQQKELPYIGESVAKAFESPDEYFYKLVDGTAEKYDYVASLVEIFDGCPDASFRKNIPKSVELMNRYCFSLPPVVRDSKTGRNLVSLSECALAFKHELMQIDLNPNDILFERLPQILSLSLIGYSDILAKIREVKSELDGAFSEYQKSLVIEIKNVFGGDDCASIASTIRQYRKSKLSSRSIIRLSSMSKRIEDFFYDGRLSFDDAQVLDDLAYLVTGAYVTDWNASTRHETWLDALEKYKEETDAATCEPPVDAQGSIVEHEVVAEYAKHDTSPFSTALKNAIVGAWEEFGESVTREQFIGVLAALIKENAT